jgi:hypothetical protein
MDSRLKKRLTPILKANSKPDERPEQSPHNHSSGSLSASSAGSAAAWAEIQQQQARDNSDSNVSSITFDQSERSLSSPKNNLKSTVPLSTKTTSAFALTMDDSSSSSSSGATSPAPHEILSVNNGPAAPMAVDAPEEEEELVCAACGFESSYVPEGMIPCHRCQEVHYCSVHCLQWDWKSGGHAKVCVDKRQDDEETPPVPAPPAPPIVTPCSTAETPNVVEQLEDGSCTSSSSSSESNHCDTGTVASMDVQHLFGSQQAAPAAALVASQPQSEAPVKLLPPASSPSLAQESFGSIKERLKLFNTSQTSATVPDSPAASPASSVRSKRLGSFLKQEERRADNAKVEQRLQKRTSSSSSKSRTAAAPPINASQLLRLGLVGSTQAAVTPGMAAALATMIRPDEDDDDEEEEAENTENTSRFADMDDHTYDGLTNNEDPAEDMMVDVSESQDCAPLSGNHHEFDDLGSADSDDASLDPSIDLVEDDEAVFESSMDPDETQLHSIVEESSVSEEPELHGSWRSRPETERILRSLSSRDVMAVSGASVHSKASSVDRRRGQPSLKDHFARKGPTNVRAFPSSNHSDPGIVSRAHLGPPACEPERNRAPADHDQSNTSSVDEEELIEVIEEEEIVDESSDDGVKSITESVERNDQETAKVSSKDEAKWFWSDMDSTEGIDGGGDHAEMSNGSTPDDTPGALDNSRSSAASDSKSKLQPPNSSASLPQPVGKRASRSSEDDQYHSVEDSANHNGNAGPVAGEYRKRASVADSTDRNSPIALNGLTKAHAGQSNMIDSAKGDQANSNSVARPRSPRAISAAPDSPILQDRNVNVSPVSHSKSATCLENTVDSAGDTRGGSTSSGGKDPVVASPNAPPSSPEARGLKRPNGMSVSPGSLNKSVLKMFRDVGSATWNRGAGSLKMFRDAHNDPLSSSYSEISQSSEKSGSANVAGGGEKFPSLEASATKELAEPLPTRVELVSQNFATPSPDSSAQTASRSPFGSSGSSPDRRSNPAVALSTGERRLVPISKNPQSAARSPSRSLAATLQSSPPEALSERAPQNRPIKGYQPSIEEVPAESRWGLRGSGKASDAASESPLDARIGAVIHDGDAAVYLGELDEIEDQSELSTVGGVGLAKEILRVDALEANSGRNRKGGERTSAGTVILSERQEKSPPNGMPGAATGLVYRKPSNSDGKSGSNHARTGAYESSPEDKALSIGNDPVRPLATDDRTGPSNDSVRGSYTKYRQSLQKLALTALLASDTDLTSPVSTSTEATPAVPSSSSCDGCDHSPTPPEVVSPISASSRNDVVPAVGHVSPVAEARHAMGRLYADDASLREHTVRCVSSEPSDSPGHTSGLSEKAKASSLVVNPREDRDETSETPAEEINLSSARYLTYRTTKASLLPPVSSVEEFSRPNDDDVDSSSSVSADSSVEVFNGFKASLCAYLEKGQSIRGPGAREAKESFDHAEKCRSLEPHETRKAVELQYPSERISDQLRRSLKKAGEDTGIPGRYDSKLNPEECYDRAETGSDVASSKRGSDIGASARSAVGEDGRRRRPRLVWVLLVLFLIAAPLGIGIGVSNSKNRAPPIGNTGAPSPAPSREDLFTTFAPTSSSPPTSPWIRTQAPTRLSLATRPPSRSPHSRLSLLDLLRNVSSDGGESMLEPGSPQNRAFLWLSSSQILSTLSDERRIQRYALATFYFSTNGESWTRRDLWMTDSNECTWFSQVATELVCDANNDFVTLALGYNGLSGVLPPELALVTSLVGVDLAGTTELGIQGKIPSEFGLLRNLRAFRVPGNNIGGSLPIEIGQWTNIAHLDLRGNIFKGRMASELGLLTRLVDLRMSGNKFSGSIPSNLSGLGSLEVFEAGDNLLTGSLPDKIGSLAELRLLSLERNLLTGVPEAVGRLTNLEALVLFSNNLTDSLPSSIGALGSLRSLDISDNDVQGQIGDYFGNLASLRTLNLSDNRFTGTIPSSLGNLDRLFQLFLHSNRLTGPIPSELSFLTLLNTIRIDGNDISGEVPAPVCDTFTSILPKFYLDCTVVDNTAQAPGVTCPVGTCCTFCCDDNQDCECIHAGTDNEFLC